MPELMEFALVGGTALSLLYGHRTSVDLDLFSNLPFDTDEIIASLENKFSSSFEYRSSNRSLGIFGFVDNVKVDFVKHPHSLINPTKTIDDIRMFSTEDIVAMKVQAILGRGRKKDFWDIAELLQHYPIADFIKFHKEKYRTQNLFVTVPQAITYFADADDSEDPISLKNQTWKSVQAAIKKKVKEYLV